MLKSGQCLDSFGDAHYSPARLGVGLSLELPEQGRMKSDSVAVQGG